MYFIIENHTNADGSVRTETTARQTFASGLSLYHERISKMVVNEQYVSVDVLLVDKDLSTVRYGHAHIENGKVEYR